MAHDLRNPLAALKGAIQYLEVDLKEQRREVDHLRYLGLMADQVQRIECSVERYGRMARTEAHASPELLNEIVERVSALQPFVASGIAIQVCLDEHVPQLLLDADLLVPALQNVLQNALEVTSLGGRVTLRTELLGDRVQLSVVDDGCGMDARQCERAVDEFFTTKASGSGLGLTFAKRVAEAHSGSLRVVSKLNHGTSVVFDLPAKRPES
jgi:signal transduction histidine kinase